MGRKALVIALVLAWGCSSSEDRLRVGAESPPVAGASGSTGNPGGAAGIGGDTQSGVRQSLEAEVRNPDGLVIELVTVRCEGECADVQAVARGGNPPYQFEWEDGGREAARRLCPTESTAFSVSAHDTAIELEEFSYAAQTASASVTAEVIGCDEPSDGGVADAGSDGGFCIENPSMEGVPGVAELTGFQLPGWVMCTLSPNVEPGGGGSTIPASDGETYLGALDAVQDLLNENASTRFCAPLVAGESASFLVDIAVTAFNHGPVRMELWGGGESCTMDELLWRSPVIEHTDEWRTYCGTISPAQSHTHLVTLPVLEGTMASYIVIDNFRATDRCP